MLPVIVVDVVGACFDAADDAGSMENTACATSGAVRVAACCLRRLEAAFQRYWCVFMAWNGGHLLCHDS